jgi:hypothetical protein
MSQDINALMMFAIHQTILSKELTTMIHVKNHFDNVCKLNLLDVQKLLLQEVIIINEITKNVLNAYYYVVCLIMILYCFVSIFLLI